MRGERERGKGRGEREWRDSGIHCQWGVNSSTELVGASKRNYFPKIHIFLFCNFLGPHFLIPFPLVT